MVLEDSPSVLSLGKLVDEHGFEYRWTKHNVPILISEDGKVIKCRTANFVPRITAIHSDYCGAQSAGVVDGDGSKELLTPSKIIRSNPEDREPRELISEEEARADYQRAISRQQESDGSLSAQRNHPSASQGSGGPSQAIRDASQQRGAQSAGSPGEISKVVSNEVLY